MKKCKASNLRKVFSYFENDILRLNVLYDSPHSKIHRKWEGLKQTQIMWLNELIQRGVHVRVPLYSFVHALPLYNWHSVDANLKPLGGFFRGNICKQVRCTINDFSQIC